MAPRAPAGILRLLLAMATAVMPSYRREWGRAISAELDYARSRHERARLVLGAARVALLPPRWVADYWPAASRSAVLAVIAFVPLGLGLYLSNVVFPSAQDRVGGVMAMDLYLWAALLTAGLLARRVSARRGAHVIAGMAAGFILGSLAMAAFAAIDNAFLPVVMHQQAKLQGFQESGLTSMRAYINGDLAATAPGVAIVMTVMGAIFAPVGAAMAPQASDAWSYLRRIRGLR